MVNIVSLLEGDPTSQSEKGTIYKEISKPREEDSASLVDELAVNTQNEEVRDNHETPMIRINNPSQGRGGCSWSWKLEAKRRVRNPQEPNRDRSRASSSSSKRFLDFH